MWFSTPCLRYENLEANHQSMFSPPLLNWISVSKVWFLHLWIVQNILNWMNNFSNISTLIWIFIDFLLGIYFFILLFSPRFETFNADSVMKNEFYTLTATYKTFRLWRKNLKGCLTVHLPREINESHGTIRTVNTTYAAALKTTTHPNTRCRKPYAAT